MSHDGHVRAKCLRVHERLFLSFASLVRRIENRICAREELRAKAAALEKGAVVEMRCTHCNHAQHLGKRFQVLRYDVDYDFYVLVPPGAPIPRSFVDAYRECFEVVSEDES